MGVVEKEEIKTGELEIKIVAEKGQLIFTGEGFAFVSGRSGSFSGTCRGGPGAGNGRCPTGPGRKRKKRAGRKGRRRFYPGDVENIVSKEIVAGKFFYGSIRR